MSKHKHEQPASGLVILHIMENQMEKKMENEMETEVI